MSSKNRLLSLFDLPSDETIFEDFGCALVDNILRHGRMFVGENYICFYSTIMGMSKKKVIKVDEIKNIEKKKLLGFIQNAIEIVTETKSYFFSQFSKRDQAYKLLYAIWKGEPLEQEEEEDEIETPQPGEGEQQQVESAEVEVLNLDSNPTDDQKHEILKIILPISTQQFFEKFYSDSAGFPYTDHLIKNNGGTNMQMTNWVDSEEGTGKTREINCTIKVKGVPFKDSTRMYKVQTYKELENGEIEIRQMCKTLDVPYAENFQVEEVWNVTPKEDNPDKCKLSITAWVVIIKNFIWKAKCQQKGVEGVKEDADKWLKNCKTFLQQQIKKSAAASGASEQEYEKANILDKCQLLATEFLQNDKKSSQSNRNSQQNPQQNGFLQENFRDSGQQQQQQQKGVVYSNQVSIVLNLLLILFLLIIVLLFVTFFYMDHRINDLQNEVSILTSYLQQGITNNTTISQSGNIILNQTDL